MRPEVTRFAPSPTGRLHVGHAFSAMFAWKQARNSAGKFLLRIEDIDHSRCASEFVDGILEDLEWLGLNWDGPVRKQSDHMAEYAAALERLETMGLLYPCFCTRREIQEEIARSGAAPHGPEGPLYPGICRQLTTDERAFRKEAGHPHALRLDVMEALEVTGALSWTDREKGEIKALPEALGDVVLARKDIGTSYHLAVTWDDALQDVTLVTRGEDLFHATHIHRLLQALLDLPVPEYWHHHLLTDESGRRLAKRDQSITIQALRESGVTPAEIWKRCGMETE